jgi:hypothetical protein
MAVIGTFLYHKNWELDRPWSPPQSDLFGTFRDLVADSIRLERGWAFVSSALVYAAGVILFAYASLLSIPLLRALTGGRRTPLWAKRVSPVQISVFGGALFGLFVITVYQLGNLAIAAIRPQPPTLPILANVTCALSAGQRSGIVVKATVTNPTPETIVLKKGDFVIGLIADLSVEEKQELMKDANGTKWLGMKQGIPVIVQQFDDVELVDPTVRSDSRYVVATSQTVLVAIQPVEPVRPFPVPSNGLVHCGLAIPAFYENAPPVDANGFISEEDPEEILTAKAFNAALAKQAPVKLN